MKKILSILLVLVFTLTAFVSCDKIPGLEGMSDKLNFEEILNKVKFWEKDETPSVTLDDAKAYLFNTYKDSAKAPVVDYDLVAVVTIDGVKFSVTWTSDLDVVTIKESNKANFWTVDLPDVNEEEKAYTLTATISDAEGNKVEVKFNKTLPVIDNTGVETMLKENVAYKLYVNQLTFNPDGYKLFAKNQASNDQNKYIATTTNPLEAAEYFVEIVGDGYKVYTMVDGAKMYLNANTVTTDDGKISKYLGLAAESEAVYVYDSSIQTFIVTIDGLQYGVGTYGSYDTLSISDKSYFKPENINVAGGQYPLTFMTAETANELAPSQKPENKDPAADSTLTIAQALELGNSKVKDQYTEGKYYVTGTVKEIQNATYGNLVITDGTNDILVYGTYDATGANRFDAMATQPAVGDTITVYGIIGMYNAPQMKNGWITAHTPAQGGGTVTPPTPSTPAELEVVTAPVAGVAYKLGLLHGGHGNVDVFFNGKEYNADQPWYLGFGDATTAVDVYLEAVEGVDGAYRLYFMNGEAKTYIRMYPRDNNPSSGKGTMEMTTTVPTEYFTYNAEYNTLIYTDSEGHEFYMGSSGTYKSISTSAISYITSETSYVAHFYAEKAPHTCEFVAGETTAPTCTEAGYTTYTCTCGKTENRDEVAATGHTFADATCTAPKTCTVCKATEGEPIAHTFADATCTAPKTCTVCQATEGEPIAHTFADATCTDPKICTVCKATEGEPIAHTYTSVVTAPTCTKDGYTTFTCTCGDTYTEAGEAATDHDFTNGDTCANGCGTTQDHVCRFETVEKVVAPTCTEAGYTVYACTCGKTENREPVDKLGHTFADATCTAPKTCTVCQATEGEANDHSWDNGTVTAPTCTEAGFTTFTCGTCQTTKTEAGEDKTGHSFADATCTAPKTCTVCQATEGEANGHSWDNGTVVTAPTCTTAGSVKFTCANCTETKTEVGEAATGHADENGDFQCDYECGNYVLPAPDSTITIAQALAIAELYVNTTGGQYASGKYYVTGIIDSVANTTYGNVYIKDANGNKLYVYGLYDSTGDIRYDALTTKPVKGDTVTLYGQIGSHYSTTQMKSGWIMEHTVHVCSEWTEATCMKLAACVVCELTKGELGDHNYVDGTCDVCGSKEGANTEIKTVTVTNKYKGTSASGNLTVGSGASNATDLGLDSAIFTVNAQKGGSSSIVGLNKDGTIRIYGNKSDGNGNSITISIAEGCTIKSVKITLGGTVGVLEVSSNGTVLGTSSTKNDVLEYDVNASSFVLKNIHTGSSTVQVWITGIEITYEAPVA